MIANIASSLRIRFLYVLAIFFNFLVLFPVLSSDYFGDDLYNFQTIGAVPYYFDTVYDMTAFYFKQWLDIGRFYPLAWYLYELFYVLDDVFLYKLFLIFITVLAVSIFSWLVSVFSKDNRLVLIVLIVTPVLFQFRFYHDPFLSFQGLVQIASIFCFLSIGFYKKHIANEGFFNLFLSLFFWICFVLLYEISYIFIFIFIIMYWFGNKKDGSVFYFIFFLSVVIAIVGWLRVHSVQTIDAYNPSFDLYNIVNAWFFQVLSTAPLSYASISSFAIYLGAFELVLVFIFLFLMQSSLLSKLNFPCHKVYRDRSIYILSLFLLFMSGFLISFSPRYQEQIRFGIAYLPIFMQYFGLSLLLSILLTSFVRPVYKVSSVLLLSVVLIIHSISNKNVVEMVNTPYQDLRITLGVFYSSAFFLDAINNDGLICFNEATPLNTKEFISIFVKRKISVQTFISKECDYIIEYRKLDLENKVNISFKNAISNEVFNKYFSKNELGVWYEVKY